MLLTVLLMSCLASISRNDPLLQGRLFSYHDTQLSRLGTANFHQIPINAPKCPLDNQQRDGHMQMEQPAGRVAYEPSSLSENSARVLIAVFSFVLLVACGVPHALVLAVFSGVADVLPYIGAFLSIVPMVLASLERGPVVVSVVLLLMLAYEEFESRVLVPRIYGRSLRLPELTGRDCGHVRIESICAVSICRFFQR